MTAAMEKLVAEVDALSLADRLRLAAELLDAGGRERLAHTIVERVALELGAQLAVQALDRRAGR